MDGDGLGRNGTKRKGGDDGVCWKSWDPSIFLEVATKMKSTTQRTGIPNNNDL